MGLLQLKKIPWKTKNIYLQIFSLWSYFKVPGYHESEVVWQEIWNQLEWLNLPLTHQPKLKSVKQDVT